MIREVALAYRRVYRRAEAAGARPERIQGEAYEAAVSAFYFRIGESASIDRMEAAARVSEIIAAAINVDPQWFWHGPDK